ncbi:MAG: hypothetical protein JWO06_766 [Bacteroidota bacterium]|nr:hypothetical protein [Bacteroidota bacterium]
MINTGEREVNTKTGLIAMFLYYHFHHDNNENQHSICIKSIYSVYQARKQ